MMRTRKMPFIVVVVLVIAFLSVPHLWLLLGVSYLIYRHINKKNNKCQVQMDRPIVPAQVVTVTPEAKPVMPADVTPAHQQLHTLTWELRAKEKALKNTTSQPEVSALYQTTKKITAFIDKYPTRISGLTQFIDYYLPTTIELLGTYQELKTQGVGGEKVTEAAEKIEDMLQVLQVAFDKQLDNLYEYTSLDVTAEIATLSSLLEKDGLVK